jgi:hypothetical protein
MLRLPGLGTEFAINISMEKLGQNSKEARMTMRWTAAVAPLALILAGCGSEDVCTTSFEHVAACMGAVGDLPSPTSCDVQAASDLLGKSCDDINAMVRTSQSDWDWGGLPGVDWPALGDKFDEFMTGKDGCTCDEECCYTGNCCAKCDTCATHYKNCHWRFNIIPPIFSMDMCYCTNVNGARVAVADSYCSDADPSTWFGPYSFMDL